MIIHVSEGDLAAAREECPVDAPRWMVQEFAGDEADDFLDHGFGATVVPDIQVDFKIIQALRKPCTNLVDDFLRQGE